MRHRIFIAINLPVEIKKELSNYQSKWPELPIRWVKPENLHLTLAFLGYLSEEQLLEVCKITNEVAKRHQPFSITLNKVCYGPPGRLLPRMIWAEGEKSKELAKLQTDFEKTLSENFTPHQDKISGAGRVFSSHITLGRILQWEFRQIEPEERPEIEEDINLSFEVNSIEIMESQLKRGGAEYTILEICPLRGRYK